MRFDNREQAGRLLALKLKEYSFNLKNSLIFAIPRGGVPVAYEISRELSIPISLVVTKKLAPLSNPEYAFGAIAPDGTKIINEKYMMYYGVNENELKQIEEQALKKVKKRIEKYYIDEDINIKDKNTILIDDGIATGYTAMVAGKYIKKKGVKETILAIPVAPKNSIERAKKIYDSVICCHPVDTRSFAVGAYYRDFHQVQDEELYKYLFKAQNENLIFGKIKDIQISV